MTDHKTELEIKKKKLHIQIKSSYFRLSLYSMQTNMRLQKY